MASFIVNILELIAAFSGFYYLKKNNDSKLRYFVYYLVFTVCVDALGSYTSFEFSRPPKSSLFYKNFWLFNVYNIVSLFFYISFYRFVLKSEKLKKVLTFLLVISFLVVAFNIYSEGIIFFKTNLKYNFIWTTLCVFVSVSLYFYEVLMSNKILMFYKSTLFYISIGLLLWWLIIPPLIFYMPYYKGIYPELINFRNNMLLYTNIYLYGCYAIGFLWSKEQ